MRLLVLGAVLVAACGGSADSSPPVETAASPPETTIQGEAVVTTAVASPGAEAPSATPGDEVDMVTYVAALEDVLAGTVYEGQALEAPEVFLATGTLFCEQLEAGQSVDAVLTEYVETLTGGPIDAAREDDLTMAGGVLGVGVVTMCPQHLNTVAASR